LQDLEELSDDEPDFRQLDDRKPYKKYQNMDDTDKISEGSSAFFDSDDEVIEDAVEQYHDRLKQKEKMSISHLLTSDKFLRHIADIDKDLESKQPNSKGEIFNRDNPMYELIVKSNKYLLTIESEILILHKHITDLYAPRFAELSTIVLIPLDYVKTVQRIGNEADTTRVNLSDLLPANAIMTINVSSSTNIGKELLDQDLQDLMKACNEVIFLDECKKKILKYLENKMGIVAPNMSAVVGSSIAAKLVAAAGGVSQLANMPACNIQVLGSQRKSLYGMSSASAGLHRGFVAECDLVKNAPSDFQIRVIRMLTTKCALAARVDAFRKSPNGEEGRKIKEKIMSRFHKIQEPPPAQTKKPLPIPEDKPRKHRAGKRLKNQREKYAMTEYRKYAGRVNFGPLAQKEYRETGEGLGMLGSLGVRKATMKKDQNLLKKPKLTAASIGRSGATNGMSSSLAFTPMQGIELVNPDNMQKKVQELNDKYFSAISGFTTVLENKKMDKQAPSKYI